MLGSLVVLILVFPIADAEGLPVVAAVSLAAHRPCHDVNKRRHGCREQTSQVNPGRGHYFGEYLWSVLLPEDSEPSLGLKFLT